MNTLEYIVNKYNLNYRDYVPCEIPNINRKMMAELFGELGFKVGAEIGVEEGTYSEILCKSIPDLKLYAIDPWKAYEGYRDHVDQAYLDSIFAKTVNRLAPYNVTIMRKFSSSALRKFEDESLDFVYIDANHELPYIMDDICLWEKKVRPGGIVSGHDYYASMGMYSKCQVKYAVDCYVQAFKVKSFFLLSTKEFIPDKFRDRPRSWMFIKEPIDWDAYNKRRHP